MSAVCGGTPGRANRLTAQVMRDSLAVERLVLAQVGGVQIPVPQP